MSVLEAVEAELAVVAKRDRALASSGLAAAALAMARELDDPGNSATSKSMCAGKLIVALGELRDLLPPEQKRDGVDDLSERRSKRRKAAAEG